MKKKGVDWFCSCGRYWLSFDGYVIAMQGDVCRDQDLRTMFNSDVWEENMIIYVAKRSKLPINKIEVDL